MSSEISHKLLLVDDEPLILDVCGAVLRSSGYLVFSARNATASLDIFRRQRGSISLVISDVLLPDMSAPEMVSEMRQLTPEIKVIFMSGYGAGHVLTQFALASLHLLVKPFTSDQFLYAVRTALAQPLTASPRC